MSEKLFRIEERPNGDVFGNGVPVEKLGDKKIQNGEDVYHIGNDTQNVSTYATEKSLKTLNDIYRVTYQNTLSSLNFIDYEPTAAETKSRRYKHKIDHLDVDVDRILLGPLNVKSNLMIYKVKGCKLIYHQTELISTLDSQSF